MRQTMKLTDFYSILTGLMVANQWLDIVQGVKTDRASLLSYKIYEPITGIYPCFRRMNGTHQIGCSTAANGDVGVLHLIEDDPKLEAEGLDWVLNKGPHPPYIVLMYLPTFRRETLMKLNNPERVSGILILEIDGERVQSFSPDSSCPNANYGLYNQTTQTCNHNSGGTWNEAGSSLLFEDWNFSIIFVERSENKTEDQTQTLLQCYKTFNQPNSDGSARDWPLCAGQLKAHMIAAVDTPTCVRRNSLSMSVWNMSPRSVCDPVGGINIWSSLVPRSQAEPYQSSNSSNGSVIVIATRLDSSGLFDNYTRGADTSATGLAALLALVKVMQPLKELILNNKSEIQNVYFIVFNGEAFDYIGSSRVVYDMMLDRFPMDKKENSTNHPALLKLKDIKYFIELDQLAVYNHSSNDPFSYFVHRNWDAPSQRNLSDNGTVVQDLVKLLQDESKAFNVDMSPVGKDNWIGLPPASLQSFLAKNPDLPGIVIANHEKSFLNKYYNSLLDDARNIEYNSSANGYTVQAISSLVATVAKTVEKLISPHSESNLTDVYQPDLIRNLLQCYVETSRCSLFQSFREETNNLLTHSPFSLYAGVYRRYTRTPASDSATKIMTMFQGEAVNKSEGECKHDNDKPIFDFMWLNKTCFKTTVGITPAKSPAFDIDGYDWASGQYSTWTESSWNSFTVKIFLKPSMTHDLLTLFFGLAVFIVSTIIIYWVNEKSDLIFQSRGEQIC